MPKKEQKLLGFHGGINDNTDPKDIQEFELAEATGVDVSRIGRMVGIGDTSGTAIVAQKDYDLQKGYGLFYYSSDYDSSGNLGTEDWLTYYHVDDNKIYLVTRDDGATDSFTLGSGAKPNYLVANGALRVSDSTFTNDTMWRGFVDSKLFQYNSSKADYLTINEWVNTAQQLKSFDDLSVSLTTFDASSANPGTSNITNVTLGTNGHICLAYWKNDDGDWNGNYQFAATPMFKGNQEGPITIIPQGINFYDNQVSFQVYVSFGDVDWQTTDLPPFSDNSAHPLMDDRIIGINWYFRRDANDDWVLLQYTDLLEGDKYFWGDYNTADHDDYGIFSGSINIKNGSNLNLHKADDSGTLVGVDIDGITVPSGQVASYQNALLKTVVTNNAYNKGFDDRKGFLRAWGGYVSPVYLNATSAHREGIPLDDASETYNIPINTGGAGTREFMVELLDENLSVIAASDKVTITVTDVGTEPPPTYEDSDSRS